ncbi:MAG: hypothetical protein OIF58_13390 [Cohaesibacter sp.]|nr:hypothetical protein [Cohaesibacter sp.]
MIPQKELDQLTQYYKGKLTENALLNKAAHLAAQKHVLLADPKLPPSIVKARTKPISQELTQLIRRLRQFPGGAGGAETEIIGKSNVSIGNINMRRSTKPIGTR